MAMLIPTTWSEYTLSLRTNTHPATSRATPIPDSNAHSINACSGHG